MQGFKSFPDRLRVEFHQGLTAIVGPNGSGKSNIADAIRWVLGEQSTKTLRGTKMEDVIFAGTAQRRKMGFAEVALTLDNTDGSLKTDYTEVTVTRRYYRSGESEYFLNQKSVRLRDVHELFMDTGIGRDGYSVIGQGRIDEILSAKPEDRREIFDEAAGITKYRWRREEAQRKLDAAAENLDRVSALVTEMEAQLEPLGRQAEKERTYNALREELKNIEVGLWLESLIHADTEAQQAAADSEIAAAELEKLTQSAQSYAERVQRLTADLHSLEAEREALRNQAQEAAAKAAEAGSAAALKRAAAENNRQNRERFERQAQEFRKRIQDAQEQIRKVQNELSVLRKNQEETENALQAAVRAAAKAAQDLQTAENNREQTRMQERAFLETETRARERASAAKAARDALAEQLKNLDLSDRERESVRVDALSRLAERDEACEQAKKLVQSKENVLAGLERLRQSRERREREARETHTAQRIRQGDLENRLRLLKELEREFEGYAKAVRAVMTRKDSLGGIRGPVSGLLQAPDEVVAAIETALGAAGGNIVTNTEEDAKRAIGMLKSRDEGRATFLPLSVIRGTELQPREYEALPGVVGLAVRLVQFDEDYLPVMRNLLGRVIVIDHIDNAIAAARLSGHRYKLVTLDGQVLAPGGAMTGGSLARSSGVLSRANELKRLNEARRECSDALARAAADAENAARELTALSVQQTAARAELDQAREVFNAALRAREREAQTLDTLSKDRQAERAALSERLQVAEAALTTAEAELKTAREALAGHKQSEETDTAAVNAALAQTKTAQDNVEAARSAYEAARRAFAALTARLSALEAQAQSAREDADRHEQERRSFSLDAKALEQEAEEALRQKDEYRKDGKRLERELQALLSRRDTLEAARVEAERQQSDEGRRQIALERERVRLESRLEAARRTQDGLTASLWEEYGLTRTTAKEFVDAQRSQTFPARGTQEDKAHSKTFPARGTQEDEAHSKTSPARGTQEDEAHSKTSPARGTQEDEVHSKTSPARGTQEDEVHSKTSPERGGGPPKAVEGFPTASGSQNTDTQSAKKQCEDLRRRIKALGSVYTGAIEEYAKLRERYDFCMTQKTDAEQSRKKLNALISELSAQMRTQFSEQFAILTKTFSRTFQEIFGGGKATLELETPDAVLESGIDMKVQIPGKTMKSLTLLSGGERAFVAIALYFAILQVRPTPFCILDEIDAALDDVNVGRFARYMRGYTEKTQFIVITHRRNTMEEADMLYGVAMPVQGISKLLPFDVSDAAQKLGL